jgi:hypothetical protein
MKNFTVTRLLCLTAILFCLDRAEAVPVTYIVSESLVGSGSFTLEVGSAPGEYVATEVSGGPGASLGLWTDVRFVVEVEDFPNLVFSDGEHFVGYGGLAIGGGNVLPGSSAISEWENFLAVFPHIQMAPNQNPPVPDAGLPTWFCGLLLGGLLTGGRALKASSV